ncbi:DUF6114 domain-containing protein [Schumannella sp. 10F1B-5-1]|uniref:DUF6114 domain-containing protein n=1 Tax=Schumannella sp. 10F1B-5-1 TaxID=2590780 RepID=UPI00113295D1|nr:DUF6114 domain-containing protein [Schumannella sp. 10F1B-5-1]TPW70103.1 hypothetical protein FJ658_13830 [Schumannella sp. 10F1B-5-1]
MSAGGSAADAGAVFGSASARAADGAAGRGVQSPGRRAAFRAWRRRRPFVGGVLMMLGGVELFFSGQLDLGRIHVQLGIEGLQATVIPLAIALLGLLAMLTPAHRVFYGVIGLALALYSIVGVNLGGFIVGMLLAAIGGILVVAWSPKDSARAAGRSRAKAASRDGSAREDDAAREELA